MNPAGLLVVGLGILLFVLGAKGTYRNVAAALQPSG